MDRNIEMFMNIEKNLIHNKCLVMPNVYIQSDVDKSSRDRVKEIIKRHQGIVTGNCFLLFFKIFLCHSSSYSFNNGF